jgi:hypothetical protein
MVNSSLLVFLGKGATMKTPFHVTINGRLYPGVLENSKTAKAFAALFPLNLMMSELNGNEKYHYLLSPIAQEEAKVPNLIKAGDLYLFDSSCVVLFYQDITTTYPYIKLGHIKIQAGFAEDLGTKDISVTFGQ